MAATGIDLAHLGTVSVEGADTTTARAVDGNRVAVSADGDRVGIAVPVVASTDEPVGVLHLQADRPAGVTDAERAALAGLSEAAARTIDGTGDGEAPGASDPFAVLEEALAHELDNHLEVATTHLGLARDREEAEAHFGYVESALERMSVLAEDARALVVEHGSEEVTVRVGPLDADDGTGEFYVEDDGVGIPEDERDEVFEWGHSGGDGTGVGLGIVALVARRHGWSVGLDGSEDGGARFEFTYSGE